MARDPMPLTLEDMEVLRILIQQQPRSHAAAARLVGLSRARLSRLIERINQQIGEDLNWRMGGRFKPPPEVRRLISRYSLFAQELEQLGRAPRVSAGTCATFLLLEVLQTLGRSLPRLDFVRSANVIHSLQNDEIDIALVHGRAVGFNLAAPRRELKPGLTAVALTSWNAVTISPKTDVYKTREYQARALWEPNSTGERMNRRDDVSSSQATDTCLDIPCRSFLHAIELVKRGLIAEVTVPDIYLPPVTSDLIMKVPETPLKDHLVAVFRTGEQSRWIWLFEKSVWENIAERPHLTD